MIRGLLLLKIPDCKFSQFAFRQLLPEVVSFSRQAAHFFLQGLHPLFKELVPELFFLNAQHQRWGCF